MRFVHRFHSLCIQTGALTARATGVIILVTLLLVPILSIRVPRQATAFGTISLVLRILVIVIMVSRNGQLIILVVLVLLTELIAPTTARLVQHSGGFVLAVERSIVDAAIVRAIASDAVTITITISSRFTALFRQFQVIGRVRGCAETVPIYVVAMTMLELGVGMDMMMTVPVIPFPVHWLLFAVYQSLLQMRFQGMIRAVRRTRVDPIWVTVVRGEPVRIRQKRCLGRYQSVVTSALSCSSIRLASFRLELGRIVFVGMCIWSTAASSVARR